MTRLQRLTSLALPTLLAIAFWAINAATVGRKLDQPDMIRAFFWNMLLFAVVVTGVNAAAVAWVRHRSWASDVALESEAAGPQTVGPLGKLALGSILAAFVLGVVGLACGIGLTAIIVSPGPGSHAWSLLGQGLRLVVPLGLAFSLVGAIAGDLGSNLVAMLADKTVPRMSGGLVMMLVAAHLLWAGVAWVALATARGHLPGV